MDTFDLVAPAAGPMIESMRAHGYTAATAIADLVDNSISATAKNVWLNFHWAGGHSHVSILDDGHGMDEAALRDAMRLGSRSPLEEREPNDLGRFGLGLKTASFSQCKRLTVASRKTGCAIAIRRWDLEHIANVNAWQLLKAPYAGSEKWFISLEGMQQGTLVLWETMDRLVEAGTNQDDHAGHDRFLRVVEQIESYLSMVFHKYLEGPSPSLRIYINGTENDHRIRPWDPFLENHSATFSTPKEPIPHPRGEVQVQGYILPHKDKMTPSELELAAGPKGWNAHQGFYVYRNRRMLVSGGWLGLGSSRQWTQEEHYRLARILVEIPNSQDHDWQIDVKKSTATPPAWLRERLKILADKTRRQAREVFAHRGAYGPRGPTEKITRAWLPTARVQGRLTYRIDRDHPLVLAARAMAITEGQRKIFEAMLRTFEETVPVARIWLDAAEQPEANAKPFETSDEMEKRRLIEITYQAWRQIHGLKPEVARQKLHTTEGFEGMTEYIDALKG